MTPADLKLFALCVFGCSGASFAAVAIIMWRAAFRNIARVDPVALEKAWRRWALVDRPLSTPAERRRHVSGRTR